MGSTSGDTAERELTVLVTGFGAFRKGFPENPSWLIASQLPSYLPSLRTKGIKPDPKAPRLPPVRILVHPEPIRVNYSDVRDMVPQLWDLDESQPERPKIDFAIHIGMAGPELKWQVERRAHRDGYALKDVDGEFLRDQDRKLKEGKNWAFHGAPTELESDLDVDDVCDRWRGYSPSQLDVCVSEDAGRYMCDFIYFSSMALLYKAKKRRNVVFLHVPANLDQDVVAHGKDLAIQLIRSIVESELRKTRRC